MLKEDFLPNFPLPGSRVCENEIVVGFRANFLPPFLVPHGPLESLKIMYSFILQVRHGFGLFLFLFRLLKHFGSGAEEELYSFCSPTTDSNSR